MILALLVAFVLAARGGLYWARGTSGPAASSLVASFLLTTFVLVRAVSLHAVDQILYASIVGVTFSSMIEAGGILVILALVLWRREQLTDCGQSIVSSKIRPKALYERDGDNDARA
jgi:hypothetical protein